MKCSSCGADLSPGGSTCEFCGSTIQPAETLSRARIFEQVKESAEFVQRDSPQRRAALPSYSGLAKVIPLVFFAIFTGTSLLMVVISVGAAAAVGSPVPLLMALCPTSFVVLGVFLFLQFRKKTQEYQRAPVLARPAVLVGKRTSVSGGSGDSSATTTYYLTAEFEEGHREEFQAMTPNLYGRVADQDAGVLFTRASVAIDFDRVSL